MQTLFARAHAPHIVSTSVRPSSSSARSHRPARCRRRWRDDGGRPIVFILVRRSFSNQLSESNCSSTHPIGRRSGRSWPPNSARRKAQQCPSSNPAGYHILSDAINNLIANEASMGSRLEKVMTGWRWGTGERPRWGRASLRVSLASCEASGPARGLPRRVAFTRRSANPCCRLVSRTVVRHPFSLPSTMPERLRETQGNARACASAPRGAAV